MTPYLHYRLTFNAAAIALHPSLLNLVANVNYIATAQQITRLHQVERQLGARLIATMQRVQLPNMWRGEDLTDRRLGYLSPPHLGDALCSTAAVAALKMRYPTADITVYAEVPSTECWFENRDITGTYAKPCLFCVPEDVVRSFDYWHAPAPLPYLRRGDGHRRPDTNYYHLLEESHGVAIDIPRPYAWTSPQVRDTLSARLVEVTYAGRDANRTPQELRLLDHPFILVQTTASEPSRTPEGWYDRLSAISEALPGYWYMIIGNLDDMEGFEERLLQDHASGKARGWIVKYMLGHPRHITLSRSLKAFDIIELARRASLVLCPDSFALHAAATWGTPTIALWNMRNNPAERIPSPYSRLATYPEAEAVGMDIEHGELIERIIHRVRY